MLTVPQFRELVRRLKESKQPAKQREALKKLRRFLSLGTIRQGGNTEDPVRHHHHTMQQGENEEEEEEETNETPDWSQYPINAEFVDIIGEHMRFANEENQLEASWCLTNLASGSHNVAALVMSQATLMIQYLRSTDTILCEQCCWCLGNLAADCLPFRRTLIKMGIVQPLLDILRSTRIQSLRETSLWCLLNLLRGTDDMYKDLVMEGSLIACVLQLFSTAVSRHCQIVTTVAAAVAADAAADASGANYLNINNDDDSNTTHRNILTELCWILVYLTSVTDGQVFHIIASQLEDVTFLNQLMTLVCGVSSHQQQNDEDDLPIMSPSMRILGNLLRSERFERQILLDEHTSSRLYTRLQWLIQRYFPFQEQAGSSVHDDHGVVQREILWLLSNICGSSNESVIQTFLHHNFHEFVLHLATKCSISNSLKQEILYMITNLCSSGLHVHNIIVQDEGKRVLHFLNNLCSVTHQRQEVLAQALRFVEFLCKLYDNTDDDDTGNPMAIQLMQIGVQDTIHEIINRRSERTTARGTEDEVYQTAARIVDLYLKD